MTNMPKLNINFFLYFLVLLFFTNITHSREPIDFIKDVTSEASLI